MSKKNVADYNNFVLPEDEMWIKKINGKLTKSGYTSGQQFKADVRQLKMNAEKYNLGGGLCAFPGTAIPTLLTHPSPLFCHNPPPRHHPPRTLFLFLPASGPRNLDW